MSNTLIETLNNNNCPVDLPSVSVNSSVNVMRHCYCNCMCRNPHLRTYKGRIIVLIVIFVGLLILHERQAPSYSLLHDVLTWPLHVHFMTDASQSVRPYMSSTWKYPAEDELTEILTQRLSEFSSERENLEELPCTDAKEADEACFDSTCSATFAPSPRERLRQVLATSQPIHPPYLHAVMSAAASITPHKYIFVTAASSNHYYEMQGLILSLQEHVFPQLSNYTFVLYDIGLTRFERYVTEQNCRCKVLDFPFATLPHFMRHLTCFAWKPVIVASLMDQAEYLIWMDACIRWKAEVSMEMLFHRARQQGVQFINDTGSIAVRTVKSMFQYFGDEQCQYAPFSELLAGLEMFYLDRFTRDAVIKPWLSCAFDQRCMCIKDFIWQFRCTSSPPRRYGRCHRFDQSGLGIILSKLLLNQRPMVYLLVDSVRVDKESKLNWFEPRKSDAILSIVVLCAALNLAVVTVILLYRSCFERGLGLCSYGRWAIVMAGELVALVYLLWVFI